MYTFHMRRWRHRAVWCVWRNKSADLAEFLWILWLAKSRDSYWTTYAAISRVTSGRIRRRGSTIQTISWLLISCWLPVCKTTTPSSTAVGLLIWEVWLQVGEQFGRGGSPMDGNPGKLLMREWDPFSLRALPRREDGPELSTLDAEFPTVFFSHFSAAICCQMLQLFFLVLFHYAI